MFWVPIVVVVYFGLGAIVFFFIDRSMMKEHVPYGEFDSAAPLWVHRVVAFFFSVVAGVPIVFLGFAAAAYEDFVKWRNKCPF